MKLATIFGITSAFLYALLGYLIVIQQIHWVGGWTVLGTTKLMVFAGFAYVFIQGMQALLARVSTLKDMGWDFVTSLIPAAIAVGPLFSSGPKPTLEWLLYSLPIIVDGLFLFVQVMKLKYSSDFSQST